MLLLLLFHFVYMFGRVEMQLCPVSSLIDTVTDNILGYPMDLFMPDQVHESSSSNIDFYNCTSSEYPFHETKPYGYFRKCSIKTKCPIEQQNLDDMNIYKGYLAKHSLCHVKKNLEDSHSFTRIITLGGSVTAGADSYGCCCDFRFEKKCPELPHSKSATDYLTATKEYCMDGIDGGWSGRCKWANHLLRWLKSISKGTVDLINISQSACGSKCMTAKFLHSLKNNEIFRDNPLSSSDIVLLDLSVNDAAEHGFPGKNTLLFDLERLVRRIFHISLHNSWPTIILLEQYPYINNHIRDFIKVHPITRLKNGTIPKHFDNDYAVVYQQIGKKYQLPIWSFRDMVWSTYSSESVVMRPFLKHLLLINDFNVHFPWYIHIYYADLISNLLLNEINACKLNDSSNLLESSSSRLPEEMDTNIFESHKMQLEQVCDETFPPLLNLNAKFLYRQSHLNLMIGNVSVKSFLSNKSDSESWKLVQELHHNVGWRDENPTQSICKGDNSGDGITETFSINSYDDKRTSKYASVITFILDKNNFKQEIFNERKNKFLLQVQFFRTYKNAGMVDVFICGKYIATLDCLWPDYRLYTISTNELFTYFIDKSNERTFCRHPDPLTIEFKRVCDPPLFEDADQSSQPEVREMNKFRISSVKFCKATAIEN